MFCLWLIPKITEIPASNFDIFNYDEHWDCVEFLKIIVIIMEFAKPDIL